MKKYGIIGTRFCGSTPLMFVLAGSKKVFALGGSRLINNQTKCTVCEAFEEYNCPIWTKRFVNGLNEENKHRLIEKRIKDKTEAESIIYIDKTPLVYLTYMQENDIEFDGFIVLFKSPEAHISSMLNHFPEKFSVKNNLEIYVNTYSKLSLFKDPLFYISYNDFTSGTDESIKGICKFIGIRFKQSMLNFDLASDNIHSISGNTAAYMHVWPGSHVKEQLEGEYWKENWTPYHTKKILKNQGAIYQDKRWTSLAKNIKDTIKKHEKSQEIYNDMMNKRSY